MRFSGVSALAIWNNATRSLTNFGAALAANNTVATSIAGAASVDLRPGVGLLGWMTVAFITGVGATAAIICQINDGTSPIQIASTAAAANSASVFHGISNNAVGLRLLNNDATHAGTYEFAGITMKP